MAVKNCDNLNILTINDDSIYYLVLGFMIDNNRLEILN